MKLISTALYDKLMQMHNRDYIEDKYETENVLESNLPDEFKVSLFQEAKRNNLKHQNVEKARPLPVKLDTKKQEEEIDTSATPPVPPPLPPVTLTPEQKIAEYLATRNIRPNKSSEVVIDGKTIHASNFELSLKELRDARKRKSHGTGSIIQALAPHVNEIPLGVFSAGIIKAMRRKQTGTGINATNHKKINWKTF